MKLKTLILAGVATVVNFISVSSVSLAPLIPLATITGHGGLYASSLTSAALLKLKAASAIAALAALTESGFHFKIGHGWTPDFHHDIHHHVHHGGGWGWSSGHRRRRSTDDDVQSETSTVDLAQYDPSYDDVLSYDQLGCGMRLVCELAATPEDKLADDGKLILELFGRDGKAPDPSKSSRGKLSYSYASLLGENSKDASACSKVYARCPYAGSEIMESLRAANV